VPAKQWPGTAAILRVAPALSIRAAKDRLAVLTKTPSCFLHVPKWVTALLPAPTSYYRPLGEVEESRSRHSCPSAESLFFCVPPGRHQTHIWAVSVNFVTKNDQNPMIAMQEQQFM
jgi:hypothetical protein